MSHGNGWRTRHGPTIPGRSMSTPSLASFRPRFAFDLSCVPRSCSFSDNPRSWITPNTVALPLWPGRGGG